MNIEVEGSRTTDEAWLKAQRSPVPALPSLSEEQARTAAQLGILVESYARSIYAVELSGPVLGETAKKYGQVIEALMQRRFPNARIECVRLRTLQGRLRVLARSDAGAIEFEVDEDLLEKLLTAGSAASLSSLQTVIDLNALSFAGEAQAS